MHGRSHTNGGREEKRIKKERIRGEKEKRKEYISAWKGKIIGGEGETRSRTIIHVEEGDNSKGERVNMRKINAIKVDRELKGRRSVWKMN